MWDKLILKEKDYERLTKGIAFGVGIGIVIGAMVGEVALFFSLGGVMGIVITSIYIGVDNRKNKSEKEL